MYYIYSHRNYGSIKSKQKGTMSMFFKASNELLWVIKQIEMCNVVDKLRQYYSCWKYLTKLYYFWDSKPVFLLRIK